VNHFLDTSVALRWLLRQPNALPGPAFRSPVHASELLRIESLRCIDRLRVEGVFDDIRTAEAIRHVEALCASLHMIPLTPAILERAAQSFPTVVRTLDALHLATALAARDRLGTPFILLTHDLQMAAAARSLGFTVQGA
jgi:predicted nucleic acid-binding protein